MQNWLVGLVAFVVAGLIILAIFKLNTQAQERSISATQQRATRSSEMALISMIEIDFKNIASNHPHYDLDPADAITGYSVGSDPKSFTFMAQIERGAPPVEVEYRWSQDGTVLTKRGDVPVYRIERFTDGSKTGMSSGSVTNFEIELLDSDGAVVASTADTRQVRVRLSMTSSLGDSETVGETQWETIIRPVALARLDYEQYTES